MLSTLEDSKMGDEKKVETTSVPETVAYYRATQEYVTMFDTLTATQERCKILLERNRVLERILKRAGIVDTEAPEQLPLPDPKLHFAVPGEYERAVRRTQREGQAASSVSVTTVGPQDLLDIIRNGPGNPSPVSPDSPPPSGNVDVPAARLALQRLIDVAFGSSGARARFRIPATEHDDDLILTRALNELATLQTHRSTLPATPEDLRAACAAVGLVVLPGNVGYCDVDKAAEDYAQLKSEYETAERARITEKARAEKAEEELAEAREAAFDADSGPGEPQTVAEAIRALRARHQPTSPDAPDSSHGYTPTEDDKQKLAQLAEEPLGKKLTQVYGHALWRAVGQDISRCSDYSANEGEIAGIFAVATHVRQEQQAEINDLKGTIKVLEGRLEDQKSIEEVRTNQIANHMVSSSKLREAMTKLQGQNKRQALEVQRLEHLRQTHLRRELAVEAAIKVFAVHFRPDFDPEVPVLSVERIANKYMAMVRRQKEWETRGLASGFPTGMGGFQPDVYRHNKTGNEYVVLAIAEDVGRAQRGRVVIYTNGDHLFVRSHAEFHELVDFDSLPGVRGQRPRFSYLRSAAAPVPATPTQVQPR